MTQGQKVDTVKELTARQCKIVFARARRLTEKHGAFTVGFLSASLGHDINWKRIENYLEWLVTKGQFEKTERSQMPPQYAYIERKTAQEGKDDE